MSALGESSATPGVTGEDRRKELLQRLMHAICGDSEEEADEGSSEDEPTSNRAEPVAAQVN